ncbi:hypothetical protein D3C86_2229290 [compost metagenome]
MSRSIDKILSDDSLYQQLRQNAYNWNERIPSLEMQANEMHELYSDVKNNFRKVEELN